LTWRGEITRHYEELWGVKGVPCLSDTGPIHELPEDFVVLKYPPQGKHKRWIYATRCMSQPNDLHPIELHLFSLYESKLLVELLFSLVHYHRTGARLGLWHTVNFGRPWLVGSTCGHGFISLPYRDGPSLENLETDSSVIKFYWLIPVTRAEVDYKISNGVEALEQRFERWGLEAENPLRKSVV
jgi:hypothetical protein